LGESTAAIDFQGLYSRKQSKRRDQLFTGVVSDKLNTGKQMSEFNFDTAEANTLWKRWSLNAKKYPDREAIIHWFADREPYRWTFSDLLESAKKFSVHIKAAGIKPGDVCAIIMRHNPNFYPLYLGISRAAALPACLAYPNPRLHPDKFRQGIEGMSQKSGLDYIVTERELEPIIRPLVEKPGSTIKSILFPLEWDMQSEVARKADEELEAIANNVQETEPFLLHHSSGTTGLQKPVVLSHRAVLNHVKNYGKAIGFTEQDKVVSWLPLYHDMGLIGAYHLPLAYGIPSVQIDPFQWVLAPVIQLEALTKEKGTLLWLPNFAYNMYAEKVDEEEMEGIDLSCVRRVINAGEAVRHDSHEQFIRRYAKHGLKPLALSAMYGMAEMTLACCQTDEGKPIPQVSADRNELACGRLKFADGNSVVRICVSSGRPIDNCEIEIVDENRCRVADELVGEVAVRSISMFDGYRNYPEKTAEAVHGGWYYTGDYGFKYHEDFYIIGRKKDIIIVAGKNIYPEDIEDAVNRVEGVVPGRVIAFGEDDEALGTEQIAVAAETKAATDAQKKDLRLEILRAGMGIDITIHKVYLVPSRWLIKSSAGKPSRKANRERLLCGDDPQVWSR
jgi:fatty-acyl-CoA synthase